MQVALLFNDNFLRLIYGQERSVQDIIHFREMRNAVSSSMIYCKRVRRNGC